MKQALQNLVKHAKRPFEPTPEQELCARLPIAVVEHLSRAEQQDFLYVLAYCGLFAAVVLGAGAVLAADAARAVLTAYALGAVFFLLPLGNFLTVFAVRARRRRFLKAYGLLHDPLPLPELVRA